MGVWGGEYFESENFGLDERERFAVDSDEAFAFFAVGYCCCWMDVSIHLVDNGCEGFGAQAGRAVVPVFFLPKHCTI